MRTSDFDFVLPRELIAQAPTPQRDQSRLLVLERSSGMVRHAGFRDFAGYPRPGDVLVLNDSRVIPARLRGRNPRTGGQFEILLLEENAANDWWVMLRPGRRARVGTEIILDKNGQPDSAARAVVTEVNAEGHRRLKFSGERDIFSRLEELGEAPLPPYIERPRAGNLAEDRERYQTVYAVAPGSVAAPTAGLHFTAELLESVRARGVEVCFLTLHVGPGTFAPVKSEELSGHTMHEERYELSEPAARAISEARNRGGRVFAVGTTTLRVLESVAAEHDGKLVAGRGRTRIFIFPPYRFRVVDRLLTNFHLPRSTLLMLVGAFAAPGELSGRERILSVYEQAVRERYRFFSYGDAMLII